jgi:Rrf2 family transcriptional regulator, iron-sulfur cluster assembly transcription factor
MQLSTKGRYAVVAMVELAGHSTASSLPLSSIAERQQISTAYLEQLFMKLRRAGLVKAVRGPKGGYRLARSPVEITIAEIMMAADEQMRVNRCSPEEAEYCLGEKHCAAHDLWQSLQSHITDFLAAVTLQDIVDGSLRATTSDTPCKKQGAVCARQSWTAQ